jgi:hypothetical protein
MAREWSGLVGGKFSEVDDNFHFTSVAMIIVITNAKLRYISSLE